MHRTPPPPPTGRGRRVTLHDVAQFCGVSICTVNKALGNKGALRLETRRAVQEAARRLGYRPNRIAQTLVRRPVTLGVVYPRGYWPSYYGPLVAAVEQGIAALDDHGVRADIRTGVAPTTRGRLPAGDLPTPGREGRRAGALPGAGLAGGGRLAAHPRERSAAGAVGQRHRRGPAADRA